MELSASTFDSVSRAKDSLRTTDSRNEADKALAKAQDKATHQELTKLSRATTECADCTAKYPGWASLPHGVFLCINCAQVHRHLGRHISQVKAVNTGTYLWFDDEVEVMRRVGNALAVSLYCDPARGAQPKPDERRSMEEGLRYARAKYEEKRWWAPRPRDGAPAAKVSPTVASTRSAPKPLLAQTTAVLDVPNFLDSPEQADLALSPSDSTRAVVKAAPTASTYDQKAGDIMALFGRKSTPPSGCSKPNGPSSPAGFFAEYGV